MKTRRQLEVLLNYQSLYKLNPETARSAMLEVWRQTGVRLNSIPFTEEINHMQYVGAGTTFSTTKSS